MPLASTRLQLISSSSGLNILCTWTDRALALVWRSRSRDAFSLSLIKYSPPTVSGSMTFSRAALMKVEAAPAPSALSKLADVEKEHILRVLEWCESNKKLAAEK